MCKINKRGKNQVDKGYYNSSVNAQLRENKNKTTNYSLRNRADKIIYLEDDPAPDIYDEKESLKKPIFNKQEQNKKVETKKESLDENDGNEINNTKNVKNNLNENKQNSEKEGNIINKEKTKINYDLDIKDLILVNKDNDDNKNAEEIKEKENNENINKDSLNSNINKINNNEIQINNSSDSHLTLTNPDFDS